MNQYVPLMLQSMVMQMNSHLADREKFLSVANDLKASHLWLVDLVEKFEEPEGWYTIERSGSYVKMELNEGPNSATILVMYPPKLSIVELQKRNLPRGFHFVKKDIHYVYVETSHFMLNDAPVSQH